MTLLELPKIHLFLRLKGRKDRRLERLLSLGHVGAEDLPPLAIHQSLQFPPVAGELCVVLLEFRHPEVPIPDIWPGSGEVAPSGDPFIGITFPA